MSSTAKQWFSAVALTVGLASTAACGDGGTAPNSATAPSTSGTPAQSQVTPTAPAATSTGDGSSSPGIGAGRSFTSDVAELQKLGIDLNVGVLIDVADDGLDRYMEIGRNGVVNFTGIGKTDDTMMALKPAQVARRDDATKNRVVIAPPFYNEDVGRGYCVADTAPGVLILATCMPGSDDQTWQVFPAGDSGQFELHGTKTVIRVDNGAITTNGEGYVGLQTIKFAE